MASSGLRNRTSVGPAIASSAVGQFTNGLRSTSSPRPTSTNACDGMRVRTCVHGYGEERRALRGQTSRHDDILPTAWPRSSQASTLALSTGCGSTQVCDLRTLPSDSVLSSTTFSSCGLLRPPAVIERVERSRSRPRLLGLLLSVPGAFLLEDGVVEDV